MVQFRRGRTASSPEPCGLASSAWPSGAGQTSLVDAGAGCQACSHPESAAPLSTDDNDMALTGQVAAVLDGYSGARLERLWFRGGEGRVAPMTGAYNGLWGPGPQCHADRVPARGQTPPRWVESALRAC
jgi:hypothetical protein